MAFTSWKAERPTAIKVFGSVTNCALLQKAPPPIVVTDSGMIIEDKPKQPVKECSQISVTEFGIVIDFKSRHKQKACAPIFVIDDGMEDIWQPLTRVFVAVSIIALQLSRESKVLLPLSTLTSVKLMHPLNRPTPI